MQKQSQSKLEERIQALNQRIENERDPELIRAYSADLIALESQLQKSKLKSKYKQK